MSSVMEEYERMHELGLSAVPEKYVCASHIEEEAIKKFIRGHSRQGVCDYCGKKTKVAELENVMVLIMSGIAARYTDPVNFLNYNTREGGYQGVTYETMEILNDVYELQVSDDALLEDIQDAVDPFQLWADEGQYHDSPADELQYRWNDFKEAVRHQRRYFMDTRVDILRDLSKKINTYQLVRQLPPGTRIHRCRQHELSEKITVASQICSPPSQKVTRASRMSAAGISMFYGAFDPSTAITETVDYEDEDNLCYTTAVFTNNEALTVIDFSALRFIPSPFDLAGAKDYFPLQFMWEFVRDLASPVDRDGNIHVEYVPTQVVTEFLRDHFNRRKKGQPIDGIIYPSARHSGHRACVLFLDHQESQQRLTLDPWSIRRHEIL